MYAVTGMSADSSAVRVAVSARAIAPWYSIQRFVSTRVQSVTTAPS
jgi:hypothetical protein